MGSAPAYGSRLSLWAFGPCALRWKIELGNKNYMRPSLSSAEQAAQAVGDLFQ